VRVGLVLLALDAVGSGASTRVDVRFLALSGRALNEFFAEGVWEVYGPGLGRGFGAPLEVLENDPACVVTGLCTSPGSLVAGARLRANWRAGTLQSPPTAPAHAELSGRRG
jgi:hypothetical protein